MTHLLPKRLVLATLCALLMPAACRVAWAGPNQNAVILLHMTGATIKNPCTRSSARPFCGAVVAAAALYPTKYFAYLLVMDGNATAGISGLQCGIQYNAATQAGVDILDWHLCADHETQGAGWPAAGTGNVITWDGTTNCQRFEPGGPGGGVTAVAGYFYCAGYSPDQLRVVPNPGTGMATLSDCSGHAELIGGTGFPLTTPSHLGLAIFTAGGNVSGYVPCGMYGNSFVCTINGPANPPAGARNVAYDVTRVPLGDSNCTTTWSVTGNATIFGPTDQLTVHLNIGAAGTFRLTFDQPCTHDGNFCERTITVVDVVPALPTNWSAIKALYQNE